MPKLTFSFNLSCVDLQFLFTICEKSKFRTHTKVRYSEERYLLNHAISTKLNINLLVTVQI